MRPNIILIMTDQQRWDTITAHLNRFDAQTPAMDTMAKHGIVFRNMFTTCPVCSPARASILSGRMPSEVGMPGNLGNPSSLFNYNITTLAHRLQNSGYLTAYHGKSHLGTDLGQLGFEETFENSHDSSTVTETCRFWRNRDWVIEKRPFFQVVSLMNPHDIYFLEPDEERPTELEPWPNRDDDRSTKPWPQRRNDLYEQWNDERWEYYRQFYRRCLERADQDIGTLLDEIVTSGLRSNTWVIFMADHGDMGGEHGVAFKGPFMYDSVTRVPMIIVPPRPGYSGQSSIDPPKGFEPGVSDILTTSLDIVPTVLDMAGINIPHDIVGRSLIPAVGGDMTEIHDDVFAEFTMVGQLVAPIRMIRTKKWKYTFYLGHGEELYDIESDPWEINNLVDSTEHSDVRADLRERLLAMIRRTGDTIFTQTPTDDDGKAFTTVPIDVPDNVPLGPRWTNDLTPMNA